MLTEQPRGQTDTGAGAELTSVTAADSRKHKRDDDNEIQNLDERDRDSRSSSVTAAVSVNEEEDNDPDSVITGDNTIDNIQKNIESEHEELDSPQTKKMKCEVPQVTVNSPRSKSETSDADMVSGSGSEHTMTTALATNSNTVKLFEQSLRVKEQQKALLYRRRASKDYGQPANHSSGVSSPVTSPPRDISIASVTSSTLKPPLSIPQRRNSTRNSKPLSIMTPTGVTESTNVSPPGAVSAVSSGPKSANAVTSTTYPYTLGQNQQIDRRSPHQSSIYQAESSHHHGFPPNSPRGVLTNNPSPFGKLVSLPKTPDVIRYTGVSSSHLTSSGTRDVQFSPVQQTSHISAPNNNNNNTNNNNNNNTPQRSPHPLSSSSSWRPGMVGGYIPFSKYNPPFPSPSPVSATHAYPLPYTSHTINGVIVDAPKANHTVKSSTSSGSSVTPHPLTTPHNPSSTSSTAPTTSATEPSIASTEPSSTSTAARAAFLSTFETLYDTATIDIPRLTSTLYAQLRKSSHLLQTLQASGHMIEALVRASFRDMQVAYGEKFGSALNDLNRRLEVLEAAGGNKKESKATDSSADGGADDGAGVNAAPNAGDDTKTAEAGDATTKQSVQPPSTSSSEQIPSGVNYGFKGAPMTPSVANFGGVGMSGRSLLSGAADSDKLIKLLLDRIEALEKKSGAVGGG